MIDTNEKKKNVNMQRWHILLLCATINQSKIYIVHTNIN